MLELKLQLEGDYNLKQVLINELDYIVDMGGNDVEVYDNLLALLEVLRVHEIIDNESYDNAQIRLEKLWQFDKEEANNDDSI